MNEAMISVIIPVYKVEEYLEQCIDSVLNQTHKNLEVILVDDGSPDKCPEICDKYALKDNRVRVIHKENGGISDARNYGLKVATGKYIAFVDSDDWIERDMYEHLFNLMVEHNADIAECGVNWCYKNKTVSAKSNSTICVDMHTAMCGFLDRSLKIAPTVWNKLYLRDVVKQVNFPYGRLHEDGFYTWRAIYSCKKYALSSECKYNYRQDRIGSIMTTQSEINLKSYYDIIDAFEERNKFFESEKEFVFLKKSQAYYYRTTVTFFRKVIVTNEETKQLHNFLVEKINQNHKEILKNPYLKMWKIKYLAYRILNSKKFKPSKL